ncbi:10225_t:CDS:2, partial [Dentiscutata erythropus]
SGVTCNAINTLSNAGITAAYQTVYSYKKKIADEYPIRDNNLDDNKQDAEKEEDPEEMEIDQLNRQEALELDLLNRISEINS